MRKILLLVVFCLGCAVPLMAQDDPATVIHIVQKGDTFESIAARYDTCIQAIIEANKLEQAGIYSWQFFVEEGTALKIPRYVHCQFPIDWDKNVHSSGTSTILLGLRTNFCGFKPFPFNPNEQITIYDLENIYVESFESSYLGCSVWNELVVYDDNDRSFAGFGSYTVYDIAECYGSTGEAIRQANPGEKREYIQGMYFQVTYLVPDITHECPLQGKIVKEGDNYPEFEVSACYPQFLEQIAGLPLPDVPNHDYQNKAGEYCYSISKAYDILFKPFNLEWFIWYPWVINPNYSYHYQPLEYLLHGWYATDDLGFTHTDFDTSSWKLKSLDNPDWANLARCIGVSVDEIRAVNEKQYYPAGIVPPTPLDEQYYLVPKPRRPCYLFQPELLQTQHIHEVKWDETLSSIAARYDLLTITLAQANNLADWNDIRAGEWLVIPDHPTRTELAQVTGVTGTSALLVWFVRLRWRKRRGLDKRKRKGE